MAEKRRMAGVDGPPGARGLLESGAQRLGIALDPHQLDRFMTHMELLKRENRKYNLTSVTGDREIVIRHFLDSLTAYPLLEPALRSGDRLLAIDLGSGAGFPGLPLRIALPGLGLVLVDARRKRCRFLRRLCRRLGLEDVRVIHTRCEELESEHRGRYAFALSRALAPLRVLVEYALPCLTPGGRLIAYKGRQAREEIDSAGDALDELRGRVVEVRDCRERGPGLDGVLVVVELTGLPPVEYPRRPGIPEKGPL